MKMAFLGIKAHDPLLLGLSRASSVHDINTAVHDDGGGAPPVGGVPDHVLASKEPLLGESRFAGNPVSLRATPARPIPGRKGAAKEPRDNQCLPRSVRRLPRSVRRHSLLPD